MITFNGKSIELLGSAEKHGDTRHYIRPDRVARTGVVPPTANYEPILDGERIAREFANAGQLAPATLDGLRYAQALGAHGHQLQLLGLRDSNLSVWMRLKLFFQGLFTKAKAAAIVRAAMSDQSTATRAAATDSMANITSSLPSENNSDMYDGGAPSGATSQQSGDALAIMGGQGTLKTNNPPIMSSQQAAGEIAPAMVLQPATLARISQPSGAVGRQATRAALSRFYAANKGRIQ